MAEEKVKLKGDLNGQKFDFEVVSMKVRHPETGALFEMRMDPAPKVPITFNVTGHTTAAVEQAVKVVMEGAKFAPEYAEEVAQLVIARLGGEEAKTHG